MKIVVTILQARRVVLPHIFIRHVLPLMQARAQVEVVLVQHRRAPKPEGGFLDSSSGGAGVDERVLEWTEAGRFAGAEILVHDEAHPPYPSIPSMRRACEAVLARGADFHLWLEDDALVWDPEFVNWPWLFGDRELGVYRFFSLVNSAFFVSRPSFDARILPGLSDLGRWTQRNRLEAFLQSQLRTPRLYRPPRYAVRSHRNSYPYTGDGFVAEMVRRLSPEDAHLLDLELGPGASTQRAVGPAQRRWLWLRDWGRPVELGRRARNALREHGWISPRPSLLDS